MNEISLIKGRIIGNNNSKKYDNIQFLPKKYNSSPHFPSTFKRDNLETHCITSLSNGDIELFDIEFRECIKVFKGHSSEIIHLFILENVPHLISVSYSGEIILWNIFTGKKISSLFIGRSVTSAIITKDERMLIIGEFNGQMHFLSMGDDKSTRLKIV